MVHLALISRVRQTLQWLLILRSIDFTNICVYTYVHNGLQNTVAPVITTGPEGVAVFEGMSASFLCSAMGRPRPNITWFRAAENSTLVAVNASVLRVSVSVDETDDRRLTSVLTLTAVSSADIGRYICLAENELSNASASAQLRLKGGLFSSSLVCTALHCTVNCL